MEKKYWDKSIKVELTRFRVKPGKSSTVDKWMDFLREHLPEVLVTLEGEKMYVETIFRETLDDHEYLYWYAIQGEDGIHVRDSKHDVDKKHLKFWKECIDSSVKPIVLTTEIVMVAEKIQALMN